MAISLTIDGAQVALNERLNGPFVTVNTVNTVTGNLGRANTSRASLCRVKLA